MNKGVGIFRRLLLEELLVLFPFCFPGLKKHFPLGLQVSYSNVKDALELRHLISLLTFSLRDCGTISLSPCFYSNVLTYMSSIRVCYPNMRLEIAID